MTPLIEMAKAVKRGARFLDKKVPGWRKILRKHDDEFNIRNGQCCILGTLEHHSAQMRNLHKKRVAGMSEADYDRAINRLNLIEPGVAREHGFVWHPATDNVESEVRTLNDLWRAEYGE